jgi:hypothetical protein
MKFKVTSAGHDTDKYSQFLLKDKSQYFIELSRMEELRNFIKNVGQIIIEDLNDDDLHITIYDDYIE